MTFPRVSAFQAWLTALALTVVTLLLYLPSRGYDYVAYDDPDYVTDNPQVQAGLTGQGIAWAFTTGHASNWHPVTWLSHMADVSLFGPGPAGAHTTNVALHAANTALVFWVLLSLCGAGAIGRCAWVAALFGLHPLHVESVAWVAERKDVLSAFFFLLTLAAWGHYARVKAFDRGVARGWYAAALGFFALGLMSKPMLVTLPCVLLLLDHWPLRRLPAGSWAEAKAALPALLREKLPFFALSFASCVVTFLVQRQSGAVRSLESFTLPERVANALVAYALYLRNTLWPADLAFFYPHPGGWSGVWVLAAVVLAGGLSFLAFRVRRTQPFVTTGWFWFTGMLVPAIGLVQVGNQALADRYTYLPLIGVFLALAWAAAEAGERWHVPRFALAAAAALTAAACAGLTRVQLSFWRDSEVLFGRAIAVTENNFVAYNGLGFALLKQGRRDEALVQFERALTIRPDFAEALNNLGTALQENGDAAGALLRFQRAVYLQPGFVPARYNLGTVLLQQGRADEAIVQLGEMLRLRPDHAPARLNLGNALRSRGRTDEAVAQYLRATEIQPASADAQDNLGAVLAEQGRDEEAAVRFRRALELEPGHANAHANLAGVLLRQGRLEEAVAHYRKAGAGHPADAELQNNLGTALLQLGQAGEAEACFRRATELAPDFTPARGNLGFLLGQTGRVREAAAQYEAVLKQAPDDIPALASFAWLLATCPDAASRDGARALELARRAERLSGGGEPLVLRTLAAACAESGQFSEAIDSARRALQLAQAGSNAALAGLLPAELALYRAGRPVREGDGTPPEPGGPRL